MTSEAERRERAANHKPVIPVATFSAAMDEIYSLRAVSAQAVAALDELLAMKSISAGRKTKLRAVRHNLLRAVRGKEPPYAPTQKTWLRMAGGEETMSNTRWLTDRGL